MSGKELASRGCPCHQGISCHRYLSTFFSSPNYAQLHYLKILSCPVFQVWRIRTRTNHDTCHHSGHRKIVEAPEVGFQIETDQSHGIVMTNSFLSSKLRHAISMSSTYFLGKSGEFRPEHTSIMISNIFGLTKYSVDAQIGLQTLVVNKPRLEDMEESSQAAMLEQSLYRLELTLDSCLRRPEVCR